MFVGLHFKVAIISISNENFLHQDRCHFNPTKTQKADGVVELEPESQFYKQGLDMVNDRKL